MSKITGKLHSTVDQVLAHTGLDVNHGVRHYAYTRAVGLAIAAQHQHRFDPYVDWRDSQHCDHWQMRPCALCEQPTPLRSHFGEPVHMSCAEDWIAANPVEARRLGRFASDIQAKRRYDDDHA
ncbi:hypothetical protein OG520_44975 (plasmid) [Streptomyces sp. NBC_00984]|uniref:hypothetical protein n=1 Tax=Streptomyces sp. NBC_00984 TaxID=2903700 RepID=UPI002F91B1A5|nr:hypothetical protein OG520_44975 [Streptomyces sp. NBC_00984]